MLGQLSRTHPVRGRLAREGLININSSCQMAEPNYSAPTQAESLQGAGS